METICFASGSGGGAMRRVFTRRAILVWVVLLAGGSVTNARQTGSVVFTDITEESGIRFTHVNGASAEKYLPETMGSGGLFFDYDNDGWIDILLVDGGSLADGDVAASASHRLYRNDRDGSFTDVTEASGIRTSGYGMGGCAADYDNDGWTDLYLTRLEANVLYRNAEGHFVDVTRNAGVAADSWSSSCAFADIENDGDVDLYVTSYVDFALDNHKYCGNAQNVRFYCHPNVYNGLPDFLFRNNGDGTFTDTGREAGTYTEAGKGLGVVFSDYDGDGWTDIYVANDSVPNFMFHNEGNGVFEESALWAGVAVGRDGQPLAGMGADIADVTGDGLPDIVVTNLDMETHSLYRNLGNGFFEDASYESGIGEATLPYVGFGAVLFDYDNDRDLDLVIGNGNVLDNAEQLRSTSSHAQRNLLLRNDGSGRFEEIGRAAGSGFAGVKVSRTLATGDLDNDGDLDLLVTNNGQSADLLRNDGGNLRNSLQIRLVGSTSNRNGIGARLLLRTGDHTLTREVKAGSSYLGQNDVRVHFGLGEAPLAERIEIHWPGGMIDVLEGIQANQILTVLEGGGITSAVPLRRAR
jgi:hypothetical protein